jgi:hypothetical protein
MEGLNTVVGSKTGSSAELFEWERGNCYTLDEEVKLGCFFLFSSSTFW